MYIVIIGGGMVGYYLSRTLLNEGHEVLILERDAKRCERITEELGSICMQGDGCEAAIQANAGVERADMLIAVTDGDEDNLVACQVAKHKFGVPRTISRINNPQNEVIFKKLGVDTTISTTNIILEYIEEKVPTHPLVHLLSLEEKGLEIVEVKVSSTSPVAGKLVRDIRVPSGSIPLLVVDSEGHYQTPADDTIIQAGDRVIMVTKPEHEDILRSGLTGK